MFIFQTGRRGDDEKDEKMDGITGVFVSCSSGNGFTILG
jgi:hypothetical protein